MHGLEMALDEISYDLAISRGRIPNTDAADDMCCKLPGSEFLSSKFWKRTEGRYSTSRLYSRNRLSPNAVHNAADKDGSRTEMSATTNKRFQYRRSGLHLNPLADVQSDSKKQLGQYSCTMPNNVIQDAEKTQSNNTGINDGISPAACATPRNQNDR